MSFSSRGRSTGITLDEGLSTWNAKPGAIVKILSLMEKSRWLPWRELIEGKIGIRKTYPPAIRLLSPYDFPPDLIVQLRDLLRPNNVICIGAYVEVVPDPEGNWK